MLFSSTKPSSKDPWTKEIWFYDYRTNIHHKPKKNPLKLIDLQDFITCYNASNRHKRKETWSADAATLRQAQGDTGLEGRWRKFTYEEIIARDKTSLDIIWLKDKSLADLDNLPDPDILAEEIVENLESALDGFKAIIAQLKK
jgi:type I restriction enzyme M protein